MVKTPRTSNAGDAGSIPGLGTKIPHATRHGQKYIYKIVINIFIFILTIEFSIPHCKPHTWNSEEFCQIYEVIKSMKGDYSKLGE